MRFRQHVLASLALATLPAGCHRWEEGTGAVLRQDRPGKVVAVAIDTSGSFAGRMDDAYRFFTAAADEYFRNSVGESHELVISQISGDGRALLWRGHPAELRTKFPSAAAFRSYLAARSDPTASRVHDGLIDTLDEVLDRPGVRQGRVKICVLALTDMEDNASGPDSARRLAEKLREYRRADGAVGIYWCSQHLARGVRATLRDAGFDATNSVVETEIASRPPMPRLDD